MKITEKTERATVRIAAQITILEGLLESGEKRYGFRLSIMGREVGQDWGYDSRLAARAGARAELRRIGGTL